MRPERQRRKLHSLSATFMQEYTGHLGYPHPCRSTHSAHEYHRSYHGKSQRPFHSGFKSCTIGKPAHRGKSLPIAHQHGKCDRKYLICNRDSRHGSITVLSTVSADHDRRKAHEPLPQEGWQPCSHYTHPISEAPQI